MSLFAAQLISASLVSVCLSAGLSWTSMWLSHITARLPCTLLSTVSTAHSLCYKYLHKMSKPKHAQVHANWINSRITFKRMRRKEKKNLINEHFCNADSDSREGSPVFFHALLLICACVCRHVFTWPGAFTAWCLLWVDLGFLFSPKLLSLLKKCWENVGILVDKNRKERILWEEINGLLSYKYF